MGIKGCCLFVNFPQNVLCALQKKVRLMWNDMRLRKWWNNLFSCELSLKCTYLFVRTDLVFRCVFWDQRRRSWSIILIFKKKNIIHILKAKLPDSRCLKWNCLMPSWKICYERVFTLLKKNALGTDLLFYWFWLEAVILIFGKFRVTQKKSTPTRFSDWPSHMVWMRFCFRDWMQRFHWIFLFLVF